MSNIKIMSFNIAAETLCINNNHQVIISIIKSINPDILGIQEINCHNETTNKYTNIELYKTIAEKFNYNYKVNDETHTVIFSKYPIIDTSENYKGVVIKNNNELIAIFNIHLTDEPYQPYQIAKIPYGNYPFIESEQEAIKQASIARSADINNILTDIKLIEDKYNPTCIIVLGDFNEPSHRDWTSQTVSAGIHPLKVEFPSVRKFESNGFIDSFRYVNPDPVKNPGFTWPTPNRYSDNEELSDRLDFILVKGSVEIANGEIIGELDFDIWPSDHRACLCTLSVKNYYYKKYLKYKNKYLELKNQ